MKEHDNYSNCIFKNCNYGFKKNEISLLCAVLRRKFEKEKLLRKIKFSSMKNEKEHLNIIKISWKLTYFKNCSSLHKREKINLTSFKKVSFKKKRGKIIY